MRQPTFVTIDMGFWRKGLRDIRCSVLCFPLSNDEQNKLPELLRALLRLPEFRSKSIRMGKVSRVAAGQRPSCPRRHGPCGMSHAADRRWVWDLSCIWKFPYLKP